MKNYQILLLAFVLATNSASAVPIDPDSRSMGLYFDEAATITSHFADPYSIVPIFLILTNPDVEAITGFEFGFTVEGTYYLVGTAFVGDGLDFGQGPQNFIVGMAIPIITSPATLLCTFDILVMDSNPIAFTLHNSTPSYFPDTTTPAIVWIDSGHYTLFSTGVSAGLDENGFPNVCAYINETGVVGTDMVSWGHVKSLYR